MLVILIQINWDIYEQSEELPFHLLEGEKFHAEKCAQYYEIDGVQLISAFKRKGRNDVASLLQQIWSVKLEGGAEVRFGVMEEHCIPLPNASLLH